MDSDRKNQIFLMRTDGKGYAAIAGALGISINTVKSHCRRNSLGASCAQGQPKEGADAACPNCGNPIQQTQGKKRRRFCSDGCRMEWWKAHPEAVGRKAIYSFVCPVCGAGFIAYGNAHRIYCSKACSGIARKASP